MLINLLFFKTINFILIIQIFLNLFILILKNNFFLIILTIVNITQLKYLIMILVYFNFINFYFIIWFYEFHLN